MIPAAVWSKPINARRVWRSFVAAWALLQIAGVLWAPNSGALVSYTILTLAAALPSVVWIRSGMPGIPIWPGVAVMTWIYYALPILRDYESQVQFTGEEIVFAAATVAGFLTAATIAWGLLLVGRTRQLGLNNSKPLSTAQMTVIVFLGLTSGALYSSFLSLGFLNFVGAYFGLVRSTMTTGTMVSCYVLGHAYGRGVLRGRTLAIAIAALCANVLLAWSSLFLVVGMSYLLAVAAGYVITTKRVPWVPLLVVFLILTILHAGKAEMRQQVWVTGSNYSADATLADTPKLLTDWFRSGLMTLTSGNPGTLIVDRASLFHLLLNVQYLAPNYVPFLNGETYALLPSMLVPRFLTPDKITSQAGMTMLNIHFGFQTDESSQTTSIGWGLIAEAFGNYGLVGVVMIGVVAGVIAGLFTRLSCGASPTSLGTFLAIIALMTMINLEADFSYLITNLEQACVSVVFFWTILKLLPHRQTNLAG